MKNYPKTLVFLLFALTGIIFQSCEDNIIVPANTYDCSFSFADSSSTHPKAATYQSILDENAQSRLVGATLLVKDKNGLWTGASGKANIAADLAVQPCNTFAIASISKVFTAAAVFRYVDEGLISLEDKISQWLDDDLIGRVANAQEAQIQHLLAHTSGIADYYTLQLELDRINKINNNWTKEEVLAYTYGVSATHELGSTYSYSNTNYLLLSILLEKVAGIPFKDIYQQEVFTPLGLSSAYYDESQLLPDGCVQGYADIYDNGRYAESNFIFEDELGIGGDGGVIINAYDLATFLAALPKGNFISMESYNAMSNWFDLPQDWIWDDFGQNKNGYGLEYFTTQYGAAIGHTGGVDGFSSFGLYFPEHDVSYVLLINSVGGDEYTAMKNIFDSTLAVAFE